jgi:hypothetical protein
MSQLQLDNPKIKSFIEASKLDMEYQKPKQKEITATILYKRIIGSSDPETTTQVFYYKQPITYKIKPEYLKLWELTASLQRNDIALKTCIDFDECLKRIKQGIIVLDDEIPSRIGAYTAIIYLIATPENEDYVKSPQPLTQNFDKSAWFTPYVDITFDKKQLIEADEVIQILASGRSIGFMSEDHTRRYI